MLDSFLGRTGRQREKTVARTLLEVECLETRDLMSATPSLVGTVLTITGSNGNDRIEVQRDLNADQLVVQDGDQVTGRFASAAVTQIIVNTLNGNDFVLIGPNIIQNAIINGGTGFQRFRTGGDVLIYQGEGTATINGGAGDNQYIGSSNNNVFNGGTGFNFFLSGSGPTTSTGASNRNLYSGNIFTDTVTNPQPGDLDFRGDPPPSLLASPTLGLPPSPTVVITKSEVDTILQRATAATPSTDGVIAIVDRTGRILGVRIEDSTQAYLNSLPLDPAHPGPGERSFMTTFFIDGAVAEARTAAFIGNNQAPLTSRTFQTTSQTTVTQREIEAYPSITDPNSTLRGPGFVAPLGLKDHFPEGVAFTPQVDQFAIEHTNRDSIYAVGLDNIRGGNNGATQGDDIRLQERFNENPAFIPATITTPGMTIDPFGRATTQSTMTSYGEASGILPGSTPRGLGTLPGGIPIYKEDPNNPAGPKVQVGAIGVFFPGKTGFADEENSDLDSNFNPNKPDRALEAEYIAFVALGGSSSAGLGAAGPIGNAPALPVDTNPTSPNFGKTLFDLPSGRIDLVGITLNVFGPKGNNGPTILSNYGKSLGTGVVNGTLQPLIDPGPNNVIDSLTPAGTGGDDQGVTTLLNGTPEPEGWLVTPHGSPDGLLSTFDVTKIIFDSVQQALITRAAIRLPMDSNAVMVMTVTDRNGDVLGQFRMPDSTIFSIDVSTAKARNTAYYANAQALQPQDMLPGVAPGAALTARTFRYLALPRFPEGIDGGPPGPFSQLNDDPGIDRTTPIIIMHPRVPEEVVQDTLGTGLQIGPRAPASQFQSVLGFDSFNPGTNFHDIRNTGVFAGPGVFENPLLNRDGIVFFPGSLPLYKGNALIGGYGVSGDGVDQDDEVTAAGGNNYPVPDALRADQFFFNGVRLPFQKFNRQPNINPFGSALLGNPLESRQ